LGIAAETRPFHAHVTLGRVRFPEKRQALSERLATSSWQAPAPWHVSTMTLFQSILSRAGASYTPLLDVPLGAGATRRS
jgi:2'-5' RNA ligase